MKRTLLFLFALLQLGLSFGQQMCERDSSILMTGALLSPAPYTDSLPNYNLATAYIGQPYSQSVTVNVPTTFSGFPIDSVTVPITGAVSNLPAGIGYSCDPPNCRFLPGSLGCILISGTPDNTNPVPDTADLGITATVYAFGIPIAVEFPGTLAPGAHFYLLVSEASSTNDVRHPDLSKFRNLPNPAADVTRIEVIARENADYQFEVYDLMGQRVHHSAVSLNEGPNTFEFHTTTLPNGVYVIALGNKAGTSVSRLVVQH
jgi:hypothetical protein